MSDYLCDGCGNELDSQVAYQISISIKKTERLLPISQGRSEWFTKRNRTYLLCEKCFLSEAKIELK